MILALNKTRNSKQTYNNINLFNEACQFHELEIIDKNILGKKNSTSILSFKPEVSLKDNALTELQLKEHFQIIFQKF